MTELVEVLYRVDNAGSNIAGTQSNNEYTLAVFDLALG